MGAVARRGADFARDRPDPNRRPSTAPRQGFAARRRPGPHGAGRAPAPAQEAPPQARLSVTSDPAEASVYVRYLTEGPSSEEQFLGRTSSDQPLRRALAPGRAEVVVFKDGYLCKVQPIEFRGGAASQLEVRLTRDITVPLGISLRDSPRLVEDEREGERLYLAILGQVVRLFVEEVDPRVLADRSLRTLVDVLNAVRRREQLLRRELEPSARQRYYGLELDLRAYPPLELTRGRPTPTGPGPTG